MSSNAELGEAIATFVDDYSIEVTPHDAGKFDEITAELKPGTSVYVAHPPNMALSDVVEFAGKVQRAGFEAVPHIIARKLESRAQLDAGLRQLRKLGVQRALVVAGDIVVPDNAFDSSLEVLQTGLLSEHGFTDVGVAGHPEGSKAIGDDRAWQALLDKAAFARDTHLNVYIASQFGFDPGAITAWEAATSQAGVTLDVHVGMAGPASLRQLARFAMLCGVGASARMLMTRAGATANLLKTQAPDELVTHVARHKLSHPESRLTKPHFFAFGGVAKTARWANAVREQRFVLNRQVTGFDVDS